MNREVRVSTLSFSGVSCKFLIRRQLGLVGYVYSSAIYRNYRCSSHLGIKPCVGQVEMGDGVGILYIFNWIAL